MKIIGGAHLPDEPFFFAALRESFDFFDPDNWCGIVGNTPSTGPQSEGTCRRRVRKTYQEKADRTLCSH
jgi:hypothetical protein